MVENGKMHGGMTADFGNPYVTRRLDTERLKVEANHGQTPEPTKVLPSFVSRAKDTLRELFVGLFTERDSKRIEAMEAFAVNVFLRHMPEQKRNETLVWLKQQTRAIARLSRFRMLSGGGALMTRDQFDPSQSKMFFFPDDYNSAYVIHEVLHMLHDVGLLPNSSAITMAASYLVHNGSTPEHRPMLNLLSEDNVYSHWRDKSNGAHYRERILQGKVGEAWKQRWVLEPTDPVAHRDVMLFLKYEDFISDNFKNELAKTILLPTGEILHNPYNLVRMIGQARAERAYMLGWISGSVDTAWTVLWLHGAGMSFEQAEKTVAQAILDGSVGKFTTKNAQGAVEI